MMSTRPLGKSAAYSQLTGDRQAGVARVPLGAVEARDSRGRARRPALDRARLRREHELRGHVRRSGRRSVGDQEARSAVEDRARRLDGHLDDERQDVACPVVERRGVGAVVGHPPGGRRSHRTGRDAPAVDEVGIDLRRGSRLIRHEWCHRVGTARRGVGSHRPLCRRSRGQPRVRPPRAQSTWSASLGLLRQGAGLTPPLSLRAPGERRIPSGVGGQTPPWGRQSVLERLLREVCAPRSSPSSFPPRS